MVDQINKQDYVSKTRILVKCIDDGLWHRYVTNKTYKPVLDAFYDKTGPMTVDVEFLSKLTNKSTSTVYRYIKELVNAGLIIEAGRRVIPKKPSSKILYDLSASLYIPVRALPSFWSSNHGTNVIKTIGFMLRRYFSGLPDVPRLSTAYGKFEQDSHDLLLELMHELVLNEQKDKKAASILREIRNLPKAPDFFAILSKILWLMKQQDLDDVVDKFGSFYSDEVQMSDIFTISKPVASNQETSYQDVITWVPDLTQVVDKEIFDRYSKNYNRRATRMLLTTPKTLTEIHEEHHQFVLDLIENDKYYKHLTKEKKEKIKEKKKEKKTIYQYLTDLKKDNLIVEAGRRITPGRSVTEILYAKKGFYVRRREIKDKLNEDEDWKRFVNLIGLAIQYHLKKRDFDSEKLLLLVSDYQISKEERYNKVYGSIKVDSAAEIISAFDDKLHDIFTGTLTQLEWFLGLETKENIRKKLLDCFTD